MSRLQLVTLRSTAWGRDFAKRGAGDKHRNIGVEQTQKCEAGTWPTKAGGAEEKGLRGNGRRGRRLEEVVGNRGGTTLRPPKQMVGVKKKPFRQSQNARASLFDMCRQSLEPLKQQAHNVDFARDCCNMCGMWCRGRKQLDLTSQEMTGGSMRELTFRLGRHLALSNCIFSVSAWIWGTRC